MSAFDKVTEWLLDDTNPLARYNALTGLLGLPHDDSAIQDSFSQLLNFLPIQL